MPLPARTAIPISPIPHPSLLHLNMCFLTCIVPQHYSITSSGSAKHYIDGAAVPHSEYTERLASIGLLVKACNFVVFQGDVENIASRSPKQLMQLFEQISG